jgi:hypothetical protein
MYTLTDIRRYLGHGTGTRRVRISRSGHIAYWGSTDPNDRQHDYWHDYCTVAEMQHEMASAEIAVD